MKKLKVCDLISQIQAESYGSAAGTVSSLVTDSRQAVPGSFFVAIKGEHSDGHQYIGQAFSQGARLVLADDAAAVSAYRDTHPLQEGQTILLATEPVPAGLSGTMTRSEYALGRLSGWYRSLFSCHVAGITGSVGKTSTKDLTAAVLSGKFRTLKTAGNFNNELGLPLTLFSLDETTQAAVVEMGLSVKGTIGYLSHLARPELGVITNAGTAHLEKLGSKQAILQAKLEICEGLAEGAPLLLNGDDERFMALKGKLPVKTYYFGRDQACDARLVRCERAEDGTLHVEMTCFQETFDFSLPTLAVHMGTNVLAAVMAGLLMGLTKQQILEGLSHYEATPHRMQSVKTKDYLIIDDTYNASPPSMKSALQTLASLSCRGRRVAVLGDMFELGESSEEGHRQVGTFAGEMARAKGLDELICCGPSSRFILEEAHKTCPDLPCRFVSDTESLKALIRSVLKPGDTVLLKASNGMDFASVVEMLTQKE